MFSILPFFLRLKNVAMAFFTHHQRKRDFTVWSTAGSASNQK